MTSHFSRLIFYSLLLLSVNIGPANASSIVWDWSPATTGGTFTGDWANIYSEQYFAEAVSFKIDTTIDGIAIYGGRYSSKIEDAVKITIWDTDPNGNPQNVLKTIDSIITAIDYDGSYDEGTVLNSAGDVVDIVRLFARISEPFKMLSSNTYWIGMSDADYDGFGQSSLSGDFGGSGSMAMFNNYGTNITSIGDMAFRLYGDANPVPEPSTALLLGIGLAGTALAGRRMRKA